MPLLTRYRNEFAPLTMIFRAPQPVTVGTLIAASRAAGSQQRAKIVFSARVPPDVGLLNKSSRRLSVKV